jgi:hypothetical protein
MNRIVTITSNQLTLGVNKNLLCADFHWNITYNVKYSNGLLNYNMVFVLKTVSSSSHNSSNRHVGE